MFWLNKFIFIFSLARSTVTFAVNSHLLKVSSSSPFYFNQDSNSSPWAMRSSLSQSLPFQPHLLLPVTLDSLGLNIWPVSPSLSLTTVSCSEPILFFFLNPFPAYIYLSLLISCSFSSTRLQTTWYRSRDHILVSMCLFF